MAELIGDDVLYRKWPASPARSVFLLVHGLGGHSARWGFIASHLARRGHVSYGIELRGFGRTPHRPRGHVDSYRHWDRDILALREKAVAEHPEKKVFLLGESLGGLVVFNLAARHPGAFAGQVLVSPAFKNGLKFPASFYATLPVMLAVGPKRPVPAPFTAAMCTRDEAYRKVMDESPDEVRVTSRRLLAGALAEQVAASRLARMTRVPALFLLSGKDELVDPRGSLRIFRKMALADKTLVEYPDMLHALTIEVGRERVFEDIARWVEPRV